MAALESTNTTLFGDKSVSCPSTLYKMVGISRTVDFAQTTVETATNYELIPLPKGFVLVGAAVEQHSLASASTTVTLKRKAGGDTIGAAFTLAATGTMLSGYKGAKAGSSGAADDVLFNADGDVVCAVFGAAATAGKFTVHLIGYQAFGESLSNTPATAEWANGQTDEEAANNKSGGDPMFLG